MWGSFLKNSVQITKKKYQLYHELIYIGFKNLETEKLIFYNAYLYILVDLR